MPADRERRTFIERGLCPRLSFLKENEKPFKIKKENRITRNESGSCLKIYINIYILQFIKITKEIF